LNTLKTILLGISLPYFALANSKVDSLIETMNDKELAGQMIMVYHSPPKFLEEHKIGNVLVMQNMLRDSKKLKKELLRISKWKIPAFTAIDQEGGKVNRMKRLKAMPKAPSALEMSSINKEEVYNTSKTISNLMSNTGINLNLAPVLDPEENYLGEKTFMFFQKRSFSNDSISEEVIEAFVKGMSENNVGSISKHFPGYDAITNSDHEVAISHVDSLNLEIYLERFFKNDSITAGTMMTSIHYEKLSSKSAVFDPKMVQLARRNDPNRMVITDDLWGVALRPSVLENYHHGKSDFTDNDFLKITKAALDADNDILMITFPTKAVLMLKYIEERMQKDPSFKQRIINSVRRILLAKQKLNLI
jgi:beta-N-acetylhexosaminidase